jgi:thiol-disulfide isomerase/thioredoxin
VINHRKAVFQTKDSILGGLYMILCYNKSRNVELLLDNGDKMEVSVDTTELPKNVRFKNSPENSRYMDYQAYLVQYGQKQQKLMEELKAAKSEADTQAVRNQSKKMSEELTDYRKDYVAKYPNTLLGTLLNTLIIPETPAGVHYLADGKTVDSNYAYYYYRKHYWDNFDFTDNRLMYAPIYEPKLNEYFNKLVLPIPDTVYAEADAILAKARNSPEIFKYTLYWLAHNAESSKVMGMDEVFVHLVENYYMKGDAFWLDSAGVARYEDRAQKIKPNVLGNIAPDLNLQDIWTLQDTPLKKVEAPYTLLVFWSPDCGHCIKEIPQIDSLYNKTLKQKGVKVYSVPTEGELTDIQKFVEKYDIKGWVNAVDAQNNSGYRSKYDVYSTPKVYLLDKDKKIIGKGLDHSNILDVLEWAEKKKK